MSSSDDESEELIRRSRPPPQRQRHSNAVYLCILLAGTLALVLFAASTFGGSDPNQAAPEASEPLLSPPPAAPMATMTLSNAARPELLSGPAASAPTWSPDSSWLAYRYSGALWVGPAAGDQPPVSVCDGAGEFQWLPDGSALLVLATGGALYLCPLPGDASSEPQLLITLDSAASDIGTSPDGSVLSFIVVGDLWLCPLASGAGGLSAGTPSPVTNVGVPPIAAVPLGTYYGVDRGIGPTPWGSSAPAYEWSPDGKWICAHYVDRSNVRQVPFPYYLSEETMDNIHRRAYPGEDSEIRRLALIEVTATAGILPLDLLELGAPGIPYGEGCGFNTFSWRPLPAASAELLVDVTSDTGQARALYLLDAAAASEAVRAAPSASVPAAVLFHDWGEWRTYPSVSAGWLQDGSGAWLIVDAEEMHQLAVIYPESAVQEQAREAEPPLQLLTDDSADVIGERGASVVTPSMGPDGAHTLFFTRNDPLPESRPVYSVTLPSPGSSTMPELRALTPGIDGCHSPSSSPDGMWLASVHSDDVTPASLSVFDVSGSVPQQRVVDAPRPEMDAGGEISVRKNARPEPSIITDSSDSLSVGKIPISPETTT